MSDANTGGASRQPCDLIGPTHRPERWQLQRVIVVASGGPSAACWLWGGEAEA